MQELWGEYLDICANIKPLNHIFKWKLTKFLTIKWNKNTINVIILIIIYAHTQIVYSETEVLRLLCKIL